MRHISYIVNDYRIGWHHNIEYDRGYGFGCGRGYGNGKGCGYGSNEGIDNNLSCGSYLWNGNLDCSYNDGNGKASTDIFDLLFTKTRKVPFKLVELVIEKCHE